MQLLPSPLPQALKHLIQPLAGEYGMHNNEPQGAPNGWGSMGSCACAAVRLWGRVLPHLGGRVLPQSHVGR